jgi:hypothetical protein
MLGRLGAHKCVSRSRFCFEPTLPAGTQQCQKPIIISMCSVDETTTAQTQPAACPRRDEQGSWHPPFTPGRLRLRAIVPCSPDSKTKTVRACTQRDLLRSFLLPRSHAPPGRPQLTHPGAALAGPSFISRNPPAAAPARLDAAAAGPRQAGRRAPAVARAHTTFLTWGLRVPNRMSYRVELMP